MKMLAALIAMGFAASVSAAVVYRTVVGQGDLVEFHDTPSEWCGTGAPDGTLKAVWTVRAGPRKGEVVRGCYIVRDDRIFMMFEDGDKYIVPLDVIKQMHERGGV